MTKNPLINALVASAYVGLVATFINFVPEHHPAIEAIAPMLFLSLFVFSAAMMAYFVTFQPLLLALSGKVEQGVKLFLQTLGIFALITLCIVAISALLV